MKYYFGSDSRIEPATVWSKVWSINLFKGSIRNQEEFHNLYEKDRDLQWTYDAFPRSVMLRMTLQPIEKVKF